MNAFLDMFCGVFLYFWIMVMWVSFIGIPVWYVYLTAKFFGVIQ